jgi:hypothetical protein
MPRAIASGVWASQLNPANSKVTNREWWASGSERKRLQFDHPAHFGGLITSQFVKLR